MNKRSLFAFFLGCLHLTCIAQKSANTNKKIIIIIGPVKTDQDSLVLREQPLRHDYFSPWIIKEHSRPIINGYARWEILTDSPTVVFNNYLSPSGAFLAEPGDSIYINISGSPVVITGRGAEKYHLRQFNLKYTREIKGKPNGLSDGDREPATSLQDYLAWNNYLNVRAKEWLDILNQYKSSVSELAYLKAKDAGLREIEKIRMHKFHSIRRSKTLSERNQYGLTNEDLCRIYDSTMDNTYSRWLRYGRNYIFPADYPLAILHDEDYRRRGKFFRTSKDDTAILGSGKSDEFVSLYYLIKEKYTGIARENLLSYLFYNGNGVLAEVGFTPQVEAILADYYANPDFPEFKNQVKEYELERRAKWNSWYAPQFSLYDSKGKLFSNEQYKGKIGVLDFWFTGCTGCVQMAPAMRKVEEYFSKDTNVVFLSISIDKNKEQWLKSIKEGKYTSGGGLQLYTGGEGNKHDVIKKFMVESYPTLEIIDQNGLFIKYEKEKVDPRRDGGKEMIAFLEKQLAMLNDGPYVINEGGSFKSYSIQKNRLTNNEIKRSEKLTVQTDGTATFPVVLKPSLQIEAVEYAKPAKIFVLSDIEGNFDQFRKLLQANKVMDASYNWTFGKGHLVFAGDMFDRGLQVTECLWLIYSLEEKAKAAGGYVHFVLGNHEIMNLQGNHNYVKQKYKDNAALMGKTLTQLYNEDSELGRWLRTKNIVEKIGDMLFMHGGISAGINRSSLTLAEINQLARPNYFQMKEKYEYGNEKTSLVMNPKTSPYWYRTYYDDKKDMPGIIDSTLQKFNVNHIVTGHTIVADTISVWYNNKVINIDTKHAEGKSEALLIEGDKFYRVNTEGRKVLLFTDEKRKKVSMN